ncbi:ComE operon protein 1 [compost metagenome]
MFKNILLACAAALLSMNLAWAQVDVNKGDQAALDGIKGIGPAMSKAILDERKKGGNFKDWDDLQKRVKGIGEKNAEKLSQAGLNVNGAARSASAKPAAKPATSQPAVKPAAGK